MIMSWEVVCLFFQCIATLDRLASFCFRFFPLPAYFSVIIYNDLCCSAQFEVDQ